MAKLDSFESSTFAIFCLPIYSNYQGRREATENHQFGIEHGGGISGELKKLFGIYLNDLCIHLDIPALD